MRRRRRRMSYERVIIVGGGRGGVAAAEELRTQGFNGEIMLLSDEQDGPYDRPACSKGLLTGRQRPRDIAMPVHEGARVNWHLGTRVVKVDAVGQTIQTDHEEVYEYDGLVIATGAHPVGLPDWPYGEPGLHVLHSLPDAWALRQDLRDAERVAVVGGGLTGCETACAVRSLAREAVLIDSNPQVMTRALGETVGGMVTEEIRRHGVTMQLGTRVAEVARRRGRWLLRLNDGTDVVADVVVSTVGERPSTEWLSSVEGLDLSDGILCDEQLRVVGAKNMVAAGTVARWPNLRYSSTPGRVGQWIAALEQGRGAARTLLSSDEYGGEPVTLLPRFWSDQFGLRIQAAGVLHPEADVCVTEMRPGRTDVARGGVLVTYVQEGRMVGIVAVNAPKSFTSMTRALLAEPLPALEMPVPEPLPMPTSTPVERRRRLSAVA